MPVKLTTEDGTLISNPDASDLQAALDRLGLKGNGYATLETSEENYIQVAGSRADGYIAEYREGSEQTHHSSAAGSLAHPQMIELLEAYRGGGSWKSMISWRLGFSTAPSRKGSGRGHKALLMLFFFVAAVSLASSAYFGSTTHRFVQRAVRVPGKVVRLSHVTRTYAPIVEYVDLTGQPRTLFSTTGSRPPSFFKGEVVTVLYDPEDPEFPLGAKIDTFEQLWGGTLFGVIFGTAFGGIALAHWMLIFRRGANAA